MNLQNAQSACKISNITLLTIKQVCQILGLSRHQISRLIKKWNFPRGTKFLNCRGWRPDDIGDFIRFKYR